jgi:hypothetical protein
VTDNDRVTFGGHGRFNQSLVSPIVAQRLYNHFLVHPHTRRAYGLQPRLGIRRKAVRLLHLLQDRLVFLKNFFGQHWRQQAMQPRLDA